MPRKGKRKAKGKEAGGPTEIPGKVPESPAEVPQDSASSLPSSLAPTVERKRSTEAPQPSEESSKQIVPAYPSTSSMSPEEILERMSLELKYERTTADWPFPKRPNLGEEGAKIKLLANRFAIDIPEGYVYHYDVGVYNKPKTPTISKEERKKYRCLNTKENRRVLEQAVQSAQRNKSHLFYQVLPAYDGRKNLYTRKPLKLKAGEVKEILAELQNKNYIIEIKPVEKKGQSMPSISLEPLHQLLAGNARSFTEEMRSAVMALETVLRHGPALKYVPVYRSFYYRPQEQDLEQLGGGREIWLGYHQSLQISCWKPTITIDTSATVFYESCPLIKRVMSILYPRVTDDRLDAELRNIRGFTQGQIQELLVKLNNLLVEVVHLDYPRKYRVHGITLTSASETHFSEEIDGQNVNTSVAGYFRRKYPQHWLRYPQLPCIIGKKDGSTFLPFEVCKVADGQPYNKDLSDDDRTKIIQKTSLAPDLKMRKISERVGLAKRDLENPIVGSKSFATEFGIRINTSFANLEGRVLAPPHLMYSPQQQFQPTDGEWNMDDKHFFKSCEPVDRWLLINFANIPDERQLRKFVECLQREGRLLGIRFADPVVRNFRGAAAPASLIQEAMHRCRDPQLAVIIIPPKRENSMIYREIKVYCETKSGLMTQCIVEKNAKECKRSVISNLCQKINAKLGGKNNAIADKSKPLVFKEPVIIIGADCTHPSPGDTVELSVAAIVGSLDRAPSKYRTSLRVQALQETKEKEKKAKEIIMELKAMVKEVLLAFYQHNRNMKPVKIIFYRDGVSEGEFRQVLDKELEQIKDACREMETGYKPAITFVVVGKRHHTRFFPENRAKSRGGKGNVPPGTTVDTAVVHPLYFDYFMCSHLGKQGTSRPAHYTVLWDDSSFSADQLQQLTYYLCYTYTRCTRSTSIPCPVMYAHLAAYRAKQYLVHWRQNSLSASGDEVTEMNEMIKVHHKIENEMYFT